MQLCYKTKLVLLWSGLPKAAVVTHLKALRVCLAMNSCKVDKDDIIYTPLPLYHTAAILLGVGSAVEKGE